MRGGSEQVFDGWTRDEYNAMVAAERSNGGPHPSDVRDCHGNYVARKGPEHQRQEDLVRAIGKCLMDSFTPPLDEGTSFHIARKIAVLEELEPDLYRLKKLWRTGVDTGRILAHNARSPHRSTNR